MSGIYIHIPFCASRCIYCDFYSTTLRGKAHEYVDALLNELRERSDFLPSREPLHTIYLGGGTPTQLPLSEIKRLINSIYCKSVQEITIEANPEDIDETIDLEGLPLDVLRISLGVQSLIDSELKTLNRRHDRYKPAKAVEILRKKGIKNISLDLMYGLPNQTLETWEESIDGIIEMNPNHISAYCLSVEEGTKMEKLVNEGILTPCDDEKSIEMAKLLRTKLKEAGYIQYEISNYCKPGYESKHNSSYWDGTPYLGIGPGAHSYDGERLRCWNETDVLKYINGERATGSETLSDKDIYNERIMLGLRTNKGVNIEQIKFNKNLLDKNKQKGLVTIKNNHLILTETGLALADEVIRELMID